MTNQIRTDRIDFTVLASGSVIVTKMWRDASGMRDIPHSSTTHAPGEFDMENALTWCRDNGFAVLIWPLGDKPMMGARAWRGHPRPVRTAYQIIRLRQLLEQQAKDAVYDSMYSNSSRSPGWDYQSLSQADLAYVGEPRATYTTRRNQ